MHSFILKLELVSNVLLVIIFGIIFYAISPLIPSNILSLSYKRVVKSRSFHYEIWYKNFSNLLGRLLERK